MMTENPKSKSGKRSERKAKSLSGFESRIPPWLFEHRDLIHAIENAKKVSPATLINTINYIHFTGRFVLAQLHHLKYEESILMRAYPEPCLDQELTCRWSEDLIPDFEVEKYDFLHLLIDDGQKMILVPGGLREINRKGFRIQLPEISYATSQRKMRRYACDGISVELNQNALVARGELIDFSPTGFRIKIHNGSDDFFRWHNPEKLMYMKLRGSGKTLFFEACQHLRLRKFAGDKEMVLVPVSKNISRYRKREFRNTRQRLIPPPRLSFLHPLYQKRIQLEVRDISTSGFSVREESERGVLIPGMIIPDMTIHFPGSLKMKCLTQVIYRDDGNGDGARCGLAILDMGIDDYSRLTDILINAMDPNAHVSNEMDMDEFWRFLFDTGFIYPKKYRLLQPHRNDFKETYRRLYEENPEIAKHFISQRNGEIYGHISMVRLYEKSWMIHHHAARPSKNERAGLRVLKHIMIYLHDMHRLPSAKMDYAMCFFRTQSRFPNRVFGDFARELDDQAGCSLDLFCYFSHTKMDVAAKLPEGWSLDISTEMDFWEFHRFYGNYSGGLLYDAMSLDSVPASQESLEATYERLGFLRKIGVSSLKSKGKLHAVFILNQSNLGFNLSELMNSITVFVINPETVSYDVLSIAINQLASHYKSLMKIPILLFPAAYAEQKAIPYDRQYQLWILSVQYGEEYLNYMHRKFNIDFS